MKRGYFIIFVFLFLILSFPFIPSTTYECNSCSDCNTKITSAISGDIIKLNTSIINYSSSTCISLSSITNITFDCQDNFIDGTDASASYGIYLSSSNYNSLQNCSVYDFLYGLYVLGGTNNTFTNLNFSSNNAGVYVQRSLNNNLSNLNINLSSSYGIQIAPATNYSLFTNITSYSNGYGLTIQQGTFNNTLTNMNMSNNSVNFQSYTGSNNRALNYIDSSNIVDYNYKVYYNISASIMNLIPQLLQMQELFIVLIAIMLPMMDLI